MSNEYRFGFSEFTTWPWSFRTDLRKYREHGADVIEVCEFKLSHADYEELRAIEECGLQAGSVQAKVHSVFVDSMAARPEDPADRLEEMKKAIAGTGPFVPKGTPFVIITGIPPDGNFKKARQQTIETLKILGEHAALHSVTVAFEPLNPVNIHKDTAVWGLDQGLEIVERREPSRRRHLHR